LVPCDGSGGRVVMFCIGVACIGVACIAVPSPFAIGPGVGFMVGVP
jgi:hypothetical protein